MLPRSPELLRNDVDVDDGEKLTLCHFVLSFQVTTGCHRCSQHSKAQESWHHTNSQAQEAASCAQTENAEDTETANDGVRVGG